MDLRRNLLANVWAQLGLVVLIAVLANTWAARSFVRLDLTGDRLYSLDIASRALMYKLDHPLVAKVYFTKGLQAPYNNHEQILVDKLEELRAYSRGLMEIQVSDPTNVRELEEEASRFGIAPIQYRFKSSSVTEMKKVYMAVAFVYGEKQEVLAAVTTTETLEYELARAIKALVSEEERKVIGWSTGHGEPDLMTGTGPLQTLRSRLTEDYTVGLVELGTATPIPEHVDALFVVGPQRPFSDYAIYQLDQFLMRGGALALFLTNTKPDLRTLRPQTVFHNLGALVGHYGIRINQDVVVDRTRNGMMRFPVQQGKYVVQMPVNYPLIPRATGLDTDSPVVNGLDSMLFPFVSSVELVDPLPPEVEATVLAASSEASGRIKGIRTIDPNAYKMVAPGEERGSFPLLVSMTGTWTSLFASKEAPSTPTSDGGAADASDPAAKLRESAPSRLVVAGSADFVANNLAFVLNLADWLVQDESLIGIRSKAVQIARLDPLESSEARVLKLANLLGGSLLIGLVGLIRFLARRKSGGVREVEAAA